MLNKENYNSHGIESETFEEYSDGALIDRLYELERIAKTSPVYQEEYENAQREVNERGIIAKKYTHDELFKENNVKQADIDLGWAKDLSDEDNQEDDNMFNVLYNEAMKKQEQSQPDTEIRKIPEDVLTESLYRLQEKEEQGILSQEESADLEEIQIEVKRRKLSSKEQIPGGLAEGVPEEKFDKKALSEGTKIELEHTGDRLVAEEIAKDHLTEDPEYYKKLKTIESICDKLEENRYYESSREAIITKTAKALNQDVKFVEQIYTDRYIR